VAEAHDILLPVAELREQHPTSSATKEELEEYAHRLDAAETRALLELRPVLGSAFPAMYPLLRTIFADLSTKDVARLGRTGMIMSTPFNPKSTAHSFVMSEAMDHSQSQSA